MRRPSPAPVVARPSLTAEEIAALLEDVAGMRLLSVHPDHVLAEKAVAGVADTYRRVVVQWTPEAGWRAGIALTEYLGDPTRYKNTRLDQRPFTDLDDLGLLVGGWLSKPVNQHEVAALNAAVVS